MSTSVQRAGSKACDMVAASTVYRPSLPAHWTWQATTNGHRIWTKRWHLAIIREQSTTFTNLLCVIALHNKVCLLLETTSYFQVKQTFQKPLTPPPHGSETHFWANVRISPQTESILFPFHGDSFASHLQPDSLS